LRFPTRNDEGREFIKQKPRHRCRGFAFLGLLPEWLDLEVHAAHAAAGGHAAGARAALLGQFGDHGFGGDQESRDGGRVLDRRANHLGRVDDALGDQVAVFAGLRVEAVVVLLLLEDLADDDGTVFACVDRDLAGRRGQRLAYDLDAGLLVLGAPLIAEKRRP